jgi:asparagine synthetase B (glutamine-hydrolysing)
MPGISFIYKKNLEPSLISDSLVDLRHEQTYEVQRVFTSADFVSVFSGYEGYPEQYLDDGDAAVLVEGLIYNKSDSEIERLLKGIAKSYIENGDYKNLIREFVDDCDGDFIILIYFKERNEFIIFNDRWGRLPSYYYKDDGMFVFSRELKFILHFIPCIEFDRMAIAEFLVFEHTLGDRTLVERVHRLSPSCMLHVVPSDAVLRVGIEQMLDVSFEESPGALSKKECIEKCKELFLHSLADRVTKAQEKGYSISADLSGGFDTRAVFGALCKLNVTADYYVDASGQGHETQCAARLAARYNQRLFRITSSSNMSYPDMKRITYTTDCTVNAWTALSRYNSSLQRTKQVKPVSVRFMGFGGEFIRHPYRARRGYKTITDMLRDGYFVRCMDIKTACSVLNVDEEAFYGELEAYFSRYPERTLRDKVKHLYFEYYNNLVNAGENRHRLHFWTVQPLWSKDLLAFEMKRIPAKYVGFDFFAKLLRAIDPHLLDAPVSPAKYVGSSLSLSSTATLRVAPLIYKLIDVLLTSGRLYRFALERRKRRLNAGIKSAGDREKLKRGLLESYNDLGTLCSYLNQQAMRGLIEDRGTLHLSDLYPLMTLMLYFAEVETRFRHKILCEGGKQWRPAADPTHAVRQGSERETTEHRLGY